MKINITNHDFSIIWDGTYYKALSDYPNINDWEVKSIIDFIKYENEHGRDVTFEIEDVNLHEYVKCEVGLEEKYRVVERPKFIEECTACNHKGCMTEYVCHIAPLESAIKIIESGKLLSARQVRSEDIEELMKESRNAANDPADFFDYIMFSWGNCQAGDRLVMERKYDRAPTEEDLSINFTPGIRFYFRFNDLVKLQNAKSDGYHALKLKDELDFEEYLSHIVVPEMYMDSFEGILSDELRKKVHCLKNDCKDIMDWSEKVYDFVVSSNDAK